MGCCLVSAGPVAGVQPLPPLRLCSCSSSLPFCPEASRRHPLSRLHETLGGVGACAGRGREGRQLE